MVWNLEQKILLQGINEPDALSYIKATQWKNAHQLVGIPSEYMGDSYHDIPLFDLVNEAVEHLEGITTSIILNHPYAVLDAALEAMDAGITQIIINSGGIPPLDLFRLKQKAQQKQVELLGTNGAGILTTDKASYGVLNPQLYNLGNIGMINYGDSRISFELALLFQENNHGTSMVINLGNCPFQEINWEMLISTLNNDPNTEKIIIAINNILSINYEKLAYIVANCGEKPVLIYNLDPDNLNAIMRKPQPRIITDQIPLHLNQIKSPQEVLQYWQESGLNIISNPLDILS
ncbi:succinyl-CoA synthetase (ADP-forming) alpha subunit [Cyanobacterium stanieri PCC 7202]|uniref:Succinyl-CoA synthetase (ADP-forming) alpha subunit n=1 Tax=Cyanobacterium stanieri (strain ATCC 29140 / PCC 7202) TaxID=292563 RepID=K9YMG6_CYASC|nr:succinyl-CoA synthetase (ADP-forming) alpha subunit [Cyanobacterium stanieri PCC 7202]